jgi:hypothetical protein
MSDDIDNVICLDTYRSSVFPTSEEITSDIMRTISDAKNQEEIEVAEALLELYESGKIRVQRSREGKFLYSLEEDQT